MQSSLDLFLQAHVAVIGDLMLDCYLYGDVHRISPEAPVPVVRARSEKAVPGGAANVAANLAALGVQTRLVGVTGRDAGHEELLRCIDAIGNIDCSGVISSPNRRTTKKLRIVGAQQQIVRIDHEDASPHDALLNDACIGSALRAIGLAQVVILSDYGKGVFSDTLLAQVLSHATRARKPVVVDPKRSDFSVYRGASVLTPNRKELSEATRMPCESDEEAAAAAAVAQQMSGSDILLTRSEKGMSYFPVHGTPVHLATVAQDVFDVSGAGDTVVAVLAAAMAARLPMVEGMRLANHAAGIVVSKMGTATVTREELAASLAPAPIIAVDDGQQVTFDEALALRRSWARDRLTVGLLHGCIDVMQPNDVLLVRQAGQSCDRLIVALSCDQGATAAQPLRDISAHTTAIGAMKGVAAVLVVQGGTTAALIDALHPDMLVEQTNADRLSGVQEQFARGAPNARS